MKPTRSEFRQRVRRGEVLCGTMLSLMRSPRWVNVLQDLPFDFVCIDHEHSPYSESDIADLVATLGRAGLPTLVRVPFPSWYHTVGVFDAGAWGVLAPYCETVEQVQEVVRAARWRPLKGRLVERVMESGTFPSEATRRHLEEYNAGHVVLIGIESLPAVENLERILEIAGIDAVFIGPADLSISMGIPRQFDHPDFDRMMRHILEVCRRHHVPVAVNFSVLEQSVKWAREGITLLIHSVDFRVLHAAYARELAEIAAAAGREPVKPTGAAQKDI